MIMIMIIIMIMTMILVIIIMIIRHLVLGENVGEERSASELRL